MPDTPTPSLRRRLARRMPVARGYLARLEELQAERDQLRRQVRRLRRQQREPDVGYLFVVTYGRSGSTLLQGILNSIPGFVIRGENRAAMYKLHTLHSQVMAERQRIGKRGEPTDPRDPWFGIEQYPAEAAIAEFRRFVVRTIIRPEPGARVVGFKEIRWDQKDFEDYLDFICEVFPEARFVFNTRNLEHVAQSGWWAKAADPVTKLTEYQTSLLGAATKLGDRAYVVHYDDYVADPVTLKGMYAWLGEEFSLERIQDVLGQRHSY